jgi:hypothetical protein
MGDKDYLKVEKRMLNIIKNDIEYMNENEDEEDVDVLNYYIIHNLIYDCEDSKWLEYDCKCDI